MNETKPQRPPFFVLVFGAIIISAILLLVALISGDAAWRFRERVSGARLFTDVPPRLIDELILADEPPYRYAKITPNSGADEIPAERRGPIYELTYGKGKSASYFFYGKGNFINKTKLSSADMAREALIEPQLNIELYSAPQVLIYHTHATESYDRYDVGYYDSAYPARSTDNTMNLVSVGRIVAEILNQNGITTVQCETQHDYPQFNGCYTRSRATINEYLEKYPSISVVLDLHRDAIISGTTRYKPTAVINGVKAAQIMIITGANNSINELPNYLENLRFAARIQHNAEDMYPNLTRPVLFDYRNYNQDESTGALLIEMGTHANTLEEAQYSAELLGYVLVRTLRELAE